MRLVNYYHYHHYDDVCLIYIWLQIIYTYVRQSSSSSIFVNHHLLFKPQSSTEQPPDDKMLLEAEKTLDKEKQQSLTMTTKEQQNSNQILSGGAGGGHPQQQQQQQQQNFEPIVDTLEVCDKAAARLRELAKHLEHGDIPNEVLQKTFQYAAYVLDTVSMDETRRRCKLIEQQTQQQHHHHYYHHNQHRYPHHHRFGHGAVATSATTTAQTTNSGPRLLRSQSSASPPLPLSSSSSLGSSSIKSSNFSQTQSQQPSSSSSKTMINVANESSSITNKIGQYSLPFQSKSNNNNDSIKLMPNSNQKSKITITTDSVKKVILDQVDPQKKTINDNDNIDNDDNVVDVDDENIDNNNNNNNNTSSNMNKLMTDKDSRRLLDEEDELAEVKPDAVPSEVREWLTSTFTRNQVSSRNRTDDKPKFRSVANAIRAGIMVDRIYRRLFSATTIQIAPEISSFLKGADEWSFDVFQLNHLQQGKVLRNLATDLLNRYGLIHKFKIPTSNLDSFLSQVELGYQKYQNPYHNNLHAADVTQTVHYLLWVTGLAQWLTDLEIFATLVAAIIHDYQHTGTTNNFHIMSGSEISLLYNDRSVLENFHISEAFRVMRKDDANIVANLSREEYREFRTLIIEMVIATDMSTHFQQIKTLKTILGHQDFVLDKQKGLSYILHSADISHPSKNFDLHQRWTLLLMEEFFRQGDMERELGLAYSPLCDRNSTLIPQSQIGFIEFIVYPTMELCGDLIERVYEHLNSSSSPLPNASASTTTMTVSTTTTTTTMATTSVDIIDEDVGGNGDDQKSSNDDDNDNDNDSEFRSLALKQQQPQQQQQISTTTTTTNSSATVITTTAPIFNMVINSSTRKLYRPWLQHLDQNKSKWQQKAAFEEELKSKQQQPIIDDDDESTDQQNGQSES
ncbi:Calcium/calmodulin-dependent 3',5'-cyclic nucleotide phosphodiesterase 1C [Dermatophagoides pteronyssinus]|uniref:Phosphodiesterase n=1 Tax=Dermatophagoides pteronyssinus TaxID=6956 RepID=A0ABQ8JM73_DERPT|nr:Calcium/calmodulin-dependent 3',5'-cyclic nucleotide phosphodiesterase 1C [Dermatophagoides pteronyssinus]